MINSLTLHFLSRIRDEHFEGRVFLCPQCFVCVDMIYGEREIMDPHQPYRVDQDVVCRVHTGSITYTMNLVDYTAHAGETFLIPSGTIVEMQERSADYAIDACSFPPRALDSVQLLSPSREDDDILCQFFEVLWMKANAQPFHVESVDRIHAAMQAHLADIRHESEKQPLSPPRASSRREEVLRQFIALVWKHSKQQRTLGFYADQLHLAPHYLGDMIKALSGQTVKQWVNRAVVQEVKLRLRYTHKSFAEIADELNFPNPSFFAKFFKRETCFTPTEYRQRWQ